MNNNSSIKIGISEDDKTPNGLSVNLYIKSNIPLISLDAIETAKRTYYSNTVEKYDDLSDVKNTLIGTYNGEERFIYITTIVSGVTNDSYRLYFDKKNTIIMMLPNIELVDPECFRNAILELDVWIIGGRVSMVTKYEDIITSEIRSEIYKIPKTNSNIASTFKLMKLTGMNSTHKNDTYIERMLSDDINFKSKETDAISVVSLGNVSDLFVNEACGVYGVYQTSNNRFNVTPITPKPETSLYFILNF